MQVLAKYWPRRASQNASLGQDLVRLKNIQNRFQKRQKIAEKKRQKWPKKRPK